MDAWTLSGFDARSGSFDFNLREKAMKYAKRLDPSFVKSYENAVPYWGPLGYVTYKRTYARAYRGRLEEWFETCARVCNGLIEIDGRFTEKELQDLFQILFYFKGSVSGRALWQLGTETVLDVGADSLQNCWHVLSNKLSSFTFAMNQLMLGGGVGANVLPEYVYELPPVKFNPTVERVDSFDCDFIVTDNREGWVELVNEILESFFITGKNLRYNVRCVRDRGTPIRRFGGTASGPDPLTYGVTKMIEIIRGRLGQKLRPIDCVDIFNLIGTIVVSGNVRRSSEIMIGDPFDRLFMNAKNWGKAAVPDWRTMSNNTISADTFDDINPSVWDGYNGSGEPYGFVSLKNCRELGRLCEHRNINRDPYVVGLNPCVTGDTLVMTTNGPVRIDKMKDCPVYCLDENDELTVEMARNPRITGHNVPILEVILDNGESIRCTHNHKFLTNDRGFIRADELLLDESLTILTRYVPEECNGKSRYYQYKSLSFKEPMYYEHTLLGKYLFGDLTNKHIHHKDKDKLNNSIDNIELRDCFDHLSEHSQGSSNPRFCGQTHKDLIDFGVHLCKQLSRRFSVKEWRNFARENNLPQAFSTYRENELGSLFDFSNLCAQKAGVPFEGDPRQLRLIEELMNTGLEAFIENGEVFVIKKCEACKQEFKLSATLREQATCSFSCANTLRDYTKASQTLRQTINEKQSIIKEQQIKIYRSLNNPQKVDWQVTCRNQGVSSEIGRKSSPFKSWNDLKYASRNHKVIGIRDAGTADVWNVTVDKHHNLFYGCWDEGLTAKGNRKYIGICSPNCGEITLCDREPCNLAEIFLPNINDSQEFKKVAGLLFKACKTITNFRYSDPDVQAVVKRNHRIGIGLSGFMQAPKFHDSRILDECYSYLGLVDATVSKLYNCGLSIKRTTMKPSGTLSLLPGVLPGIAASLGDFVIRTVRFASNNPLVKICADHGYPVEPRLKMDGSIDESTVVISFPATYKGIHASSLTIAQALDWAKFVQTWWSDNSVSVTHYYQPDAVSQIQDWFRANYDSSIKSCSFLLETGHGFRQAPIQPVTELEYHKLLTRVTPITHAHIEAEVLDYDMELECTGGVCAVR